MLSPAEQVPAPPSGCQGLFRQFILLVWAWSTPCPHLSIWTLTKSAQAPCPPPSICPSVHLSICPSTTPFICPPTKSAWAPCPSLSSSLGLVPSLSVVTTG